MNINIDHEALRLRNNVQSTWNTPQQWQALREHYAYELPKILATPAEVYAIDKYATGWHEQATPIEKTAWADMTLLRMAFYPQYPIGKYFVDFASPAMRVVIELDGAAYHDAAKDAQRDSVLKQKGWTVYRITGSKAKRGGDIVEILERLHMETPEALKVVIQRWAHGTGIGVLTGIRNLHFHKPQIDCDLPMENEEEEYAYLFNYAQEEAMASARRCCTTR